jgi:hypothetical protein
VPLRARPTSWWTCWGWFLYPIRRENGRDVVDRALLIDADGEVRVDRLGALALNHPYRGAVM